MKVYVVRHGQSECNRLDLRCGWSQTPLSELGHQQAKSANAYLKDIPFDRVYCSDLPRAVQTCKDALPDCQPILTPKVREISVGAMSDRTFDDCIAEYGDRYHHAMRVLDFREFGGESREEMRDRLYGFFKELEQLEGVERVAVFGHEGTAQQLLNYAFDADIYLEHMVIENASVCVFEYKNGIWTLLKWSYTGKLD